VEDKIRYFEECW